MIIIKLMGGLGNQMFQYASAYAIAKRNRTSLAIDTSWYTDSNSTVWTMSYELDCFNLSSKLISPDRFMLVDAVKRRPSRPLSKKKVVAYVEDGLPFDPSVLKAGSDLRLDGYWQSEKYFKDFRADILKEFSFKSAPEKDNAKLAQSIKETTAVSLHVRRGDYANHAKTNSVHGLMTLEYYRRAIDVISKRVKNPHFFVFSDEPEWCKENLPIKQPHTFVSGNKKGCYDMQLMTQCKHHILANSSFSWWGAWLNPSTEKIVIAPKKWFNDESLNSSDLVPEAWERV